MSVYPPGHIEGFLPNWIEPLFVLLVVVGFAFPRRPVRVFCSATHAYFFLAAPLYHRQNLHATFEAGIWIAVVFFAYAARFFLTDPHSEHGQVRLEKIASSGEQKLSISTRLWYGFRLGCSLRGIGWSYRVKGIPAGSPPGYPRPKFVFGNLIKFTGFSLQSLTIGYMFAYASPMGRSPPKCLFQQGTAYVLLYGLTDLYYTYLRVNGLYCLAGILAVGSGLSSPEMWPPVFGPLEDSYTVRKFWGSTWHQLNRHWFELTSNWLVHSVLSIRRGTFLSNYGKLFVAFFCSWAFHVWGPFCATRKDLGTFRFFMGQFLVIFVEERAMEIMRSCGIQGLRWKAFGYVWTWFWIIYSWGVWKDPLCETGFYQTPPLDLAPVRRFVEKYLA